MMYLAGEYKGEKNKEHKRNTQKKEEKILI